jgi:hypothetical protein
MEVTGHPNAHLELAGKGRSRRLAPTHKPGLEFMFSNDFCIFCIFCIFRTRDFFAFYACVLSVSDRLIPLQENLSATRTQ